MLPTSLHGAPDRNMAESMPGSLPASFSSNNVPVVFRKPFIWEMATLVAGACDASIPDSEGRIIIEIGTATSS